MKTCLLGVGICLSLCSSSAGPLHLALVWTCYEIYSCVPLSWTLTHPTPRSFCQDCGRRFNGLLQPSQSINTPLTSATFSHTGSDFQSLGRRQHRQKQCAHRPHSLGSSPLCLDELQAQGDGRGLSCRESDSKRLYHFHLEVFYIQHPFILVSHIIAVADVLQGTGIL